VAHNNRIYPLTIDRAIRFGPDSAFSFVQISFIASMDSRTRLKRVA
jgi:hypothetical protein